MKATSTRPAAVLGLDVGKSSHWACLVDRDGEVLASAPVRNREAELDALFASAPAGTLVVVDQFRNIGSLAVRPAPRGSGSPTCPGSPPAAPRAIRRRGQGRRARRRGDRAGPPWACRAPCRGTWPRRRLEAARALSSQRDHVVACATRDKNRLRAVLLESCPALEAAVDLLGTGGGWSCSPGSAGRGGSPAPGPNRRAEAAGEAAAASTAPPPALVEAENRQVRFLAARISESSTRPRPRGRDGGAARGRRDLRVPAHRARHRPGPAAQLAVSVDIGRFPDHDHLASYCGIAPRVRSSGTSVRSVRASRRGDARLKSLLIFSCNSLVRLPGRYGEYYRACRARGMGHGRALKAVARKRLRAIYAVMRDRVPYRE